MGISGMKNIYQNNIFFHPIHSGEYSSIKLNVMFVGTLNKTNDKHFCHLYSWKIVLSELACKVDFPSICYIVRGGPSLSMRRRKTHHPHACEYSTHATATQRQERPEEIERQRPTGAKATVAHRNASRRLRSRVRRNTSN